MSVHELLKNSFPRYGEVREYPVTPRGYFIGLLIIFFCIYVQYVVKGYSHFASGFVIYGIPIATASFLCGRAILRRALRCNLSALKIGLGIFGIFSLLGMVIAAIVLALTLMVDPAASNVLHKPNPVLHIPHRYAWIMVWVSLFVVGPAEEYIFRGFVYGGLLSLFRGRSWLFLAFVSSALFALAHLYYALVYGVASLAMFSELILIGMAFALIFYLSGGNLLIPALLHGVYDASGFVGVAVSSDIGMALRTGLILLGLLVALVLLGRTALSGSGPS